MFCGALSLCVTLDSCHFLCLFVYVCEREREDSAIQATLTRKLVQSKPTKYFFFFFTAFAVSYFDKLKQLDTYEDAPLLFYYDDEQ